MAATLPVGQEPPAFERDPIPLDRDPIPLERWVFVAGVAAVALVLVSIIALPLGTLLVKSFTDTDGAFVGLANYRAYFSTPALVQSLWNSVWVSGLTTGIVIPLAFAYAYAMTRTTLRFKPLFMAVALLPLFTPSLLSAISFIYIFGNQGFLKSWLLGGTVYGPIGIVLSQVFYCFPHAFLVIVTALGLADQRLYDAAQAMGTSRWRTFTAVTLPGVKYGLISAAFVVFTLVITDFGIPKVIGGQFAMLATDAYKQVVGQQNFPMGAVVGFILLVPALLAFVTDRVVQRRQVALLSARAVPLVPRRNPLADGLAAAFCTGFGLLLVGVLAVAVWASFVTYWPYNLGLSTKNYRFDEFDAAGWQPYLNSLVMAAAASVIGTVLIFLGAYFVEKGRGLAAGRSLIHLLAMLPMAVPGLVLGLAYVFFFNAPWNPLGFLYTTLLLLAINCVAHFYTVAHITGLTALKQIDREFESVSQSLKVPFWRTMSRVTVPICMPVILEVAVYLFVNALTTVSAVVFLYGAQTKLAAISIVHLDEAGATASAAAMAAVVLATALGAKVIHLAAGRWAFGRWQAWRRR
jgi:iron(III) transport system permease protein